MLVRINDLKKITNHHFEEELHFKKEDIEKVSFLKEVNKAYGKVELKVLEDFIIAKLTLDADLTLLSTRSLKDVPFKINDSMEITFSFDETYLNDDQVIYLKDNEIDFDYYFIQLISESIPYKVIGDDDEFLSGDSWEVISEDEYNKRKEQNKNSAFKELEGLYEEDN